MHTRTQNTCGRVEVNPQVFLVHSKRPCLQVSSALRATVISILGFNTQNKDHYLERSGERGGGQEFSFRVNGWVFEGNVF